MRTSGHLLLRNSRTTDWPDAAKHRKFLAKRRWPIWQSAAGSGNPPHKVAKPAKFLFRLVPWLAAYALLSSPSIASSDLSFSAPDDALRMNGEAGHFGGTLVFSQRSEPKTLNPLIASDGRSKEIIGLMTADLIHINPQTLEAKPALASSWAVSPNHLVYTLHLRHGLRFSDGHPVTADDVVFTFACYLDQRAHAPQRDLLVISGKPIAVRKLDDYTVTFTLAQPYAAAERLFDGIAILPRHLLQQYSDDATLPAAWGLNTSPAAIAGLGPFRLKEYVPGQRLILERNPYYWKKDASGQTLPYLDRIVSLFSPNADAEAMRFEAGDTDVISRLTSGNFAVLEKDEKQRGFHLEDLGPGLEYDFLFFNQNSFANSPPSLKTAQSWFRQEPFREAISIAIDRQAIARLAYRGRADPLAVQVTPANKLWVDPQIRPPVRSVPRALDLLRRAGFSWTANNALLDPSHSPVHFSLSMNAANSEQLQTATLIQHDLQEIGVDLHLAGSDFHSFLDQIFTSFRYDAAILALADGDSDPNSELNVLLSSGSSHVWQLKSSSPPEPWQHEIDSLMKQQMVTPDYHQRKRLYDRVQALMWENMPVICLISPHILVGAKNLIGNFRPAILGNSTLWNAEQLFLRTHKDVVTAPARPRRQAR